jgi:hypothetical protein
MKTMDVTHVTGSQIIDGTRACTLDMRTRVTLSRALKTLCFLEIGKLSHDE